MNALPPSGLPAACVQDAERPGPRRIGQLVPVHCGEKRRQAERARCAKARAAGILYGWQRCRTVPRWSASDRSKRRDRARQDARTCTRCGTHPPVEGGTVCEPCHVARRDREREQYAMRRAAGLCGRCGTPAPSDAARCDRCARSAANRSRKKAKNARSQQRYVRRRVRGLCIDCAAPSQGAARCPPCARRSWARSGEYRGLPVLAPRYTVIEIASEADHGTWENWAEVAACLAFARLSPRRGRDPDRSVEHHLVSGTGRPNTRCRWLRALPGICAFAPLAAHRHEIPIHLSPVGS